MATLAAPGVSATARSRPDVTDHDLVQAVRAGDDHAFERLYHRYHRRISAYIFGMVHDHGRAEDLTQEVFVSALRRMRQTEREIAFKPWIYEIAKNACIDAFRRSRRTEEVSIDADDGHGLAAADHGKLHATGPSPEAAVEGKQELAHLTGAFGGLSDAHHQILVMRELEGLSYREIGERLGMTRPSVESTLFRARRRLTEEFEELRTGERCVRIQEIIGRGAKAGGRLGARDQRRVSSHVVHCQPCRKHAIMAGLDAGAMARRPVRAKLGALLPLPAFIRRRWFGGGGGGSDAAAHAGTMTKATMAAAQYGDSSMAGWMKATAVATAVAVAGVGAGAAHQVTAGEGGGAKRPEAVRSAAAGASAKAPATAVASASKVSAPRATPRSARHSVVRRAGGGGGSASHSSSVGSGGGSAAGDTAAGKHDPGAGTFSGARHDDASAASRPGGASSSSSSSDAKKPASNSDGGGSASGSGATDPVSSAVNQTTGAVNQAAAPATQQPLVQPDLGALTQQPASAAAPATLGGAVQNTTNTLGTTVGGTAGQAVKDTGAAVGGTVDKVTTGLTNAASQLLGGGAGQ